MPLLALSGSWQLADLFIVLERFGNVVRAPSKDTILSAATRKVGTGVGFLYERGYLGPILLAIVAEILALPLFFVMRRESVRNFRGRTADP